MDKAHKNLKAVLSVILAGWTLWVLAGCGVDQSIPKASILSSGKITLSWNEVPGATTYNIYMTTSPGVTRLNSYRIPSASPPITITDLEPGTTYYFMVSVLNDLGESRQSREIAHTVTDVEGIVNFGDLFQESGRDDKSLKSAPAAAVPPVKKKQVVAKPEAQPKATPKGKPAGEIIICYGDSITYGTGAPAGMDYPSQLARLIGRPVVNKGIAGDTTASALRRLKRDVLSQNPDIVLITLGGNDLKNGISKNTAFSNLKAIVEAIQNQGAKVIIGGLKFPTMDRGFGQGYQELAKQTGAVLIPNIYDGIMNNPELMSDPIHPNESGYRIIAQRFQQAMALQKTSRTIARGATGTRNVTIAWNPVGGVKAYNIYWHDKENVSKKNYKKCGHIKGKTQYSLEGLKRNKRYWVVVTSANYECGNRNFVISDDKVCKSWINDKNCESEESDPLPIPAE